MPYSVSSARMSIETGEMRWLGNERKCGETFLFRSVPGDQSSWFTNFQRGNFSEQSILHLTSMEHLILLTFFISLSVFLFSFRVVFCMVLNLSTTPLSKYWEQSKVSVREKSRHTVKRYLNITCTWFKANLCIVMCYMSNIRDFLIIS